MSSPSAPVSGSQPSVIAPVPPPSEFASASASSPASEPPALAPESLPPDHMQAVAGSNVSTSSDQEDDKGDEGDEEEDTEACSINYDHSRHGVTINEMVSLRFNPGSLSFVENIRWAMDLSKDKDALDRNRGRCTHGDSLDHTVKRSLTSLGFEPRTFPLSGWTTLPLSYPVMLGYR